MLLLRQTRPDVGEEQDVHKRRRIRCPRCGWEPSRHDRWMCLCLHVWNTFDTGGVCPACGHVWRDTRCRRCHEWSPHADWYAEEGPGGA